MLFLLIVLTVVIVCFTQVIYTVPNGYEYIIERAGSFHSIQTAGIRIKLPFIDQIKKKVFIEDRNMHFDKTPIISADNHTLQITIDAYFKVIDSYLFCYTSDNALTAFEFLVITAARNVLGNYQMNEILEQQNKITHEILNITKEAAINFGIQTDLVSLEIFNVN